MAWNSSAGGAPPAVLSIVAGLGNPGEQYAETRHNLGFMVVRGLVARHGIKDRKGHPLALLNHGLVEGQPVLFARPRTYMNLSGRAVGWLAQSRQVPPGRILAVVDELALPLGQIRIRPGGSAGGHNGLKSLIEELATSDFPRLRLGIGPLPEGVEAADFVLDRFRPEELEAVTGMVERACDCVETWLAGGVQQAMNVFNQSPRKEEARVESPGPTAGSATLPVVSTDEETPGPPDR
ncbi:MAG: aminoacyl-tRNA hydrolase [Armatimonadetes bacterium]|nr:aminoacyl-tRNA hydrolase [Armatimonadota bacterium]